MTKTRSDPIDLHVGQRLRLARHLAGMSQTAVAQVLDLSFQQVQKYEKGVNRIGAGRLFRLARLYGVPVTFFYQELPEDLGASLPTSAQPAAMVEPPQSLELGEIGSRRAVLKLVKAYSQILDDNLKGAVLSFVSVLSRSESLKQNEPMAGSR